jgi:hypothetical protein
MRILTEDARLICDHKLGRVEITPSQQFVTIAARRVIVEPDLEHKKIKGCPNIQITIKPCRETLAVKEGYSSLLRIAGARVALDAVRGLTNGTPPATVEYRVDEPGQTLVGEIP